MDTIFALSSGAAPAGIGVIRVSGPRAFEAVGAMIGRLPPARSARIRAVRNDRGDLLDRALILLFPGPSTATGEDLAELHCHGGRAVISAVLAALGEQPGLRGAVAGEFTRRALANGRIDLAEASGLADLLSADTERQRVAALAAAEGIVSQRVRGWLDRLAMLAALTEAQLDFSDEDDVGADDGLANVHRERTALAAELAAILDNPPVERLRDGVHLVLAGPPNSGKSTLINALSQREVAIVSSIAGTTRDRIEATVTRQGIVYVLTDTAGLTVTANPIERIGIERAEHAILRADILLWLGDEAPPRDDALWVQSRSDQLGRPRVPGAHIAVSQSDAKSIEALWSMIATQAEGMIPRSDALAFRESERQACRVALEAIRPHESDALIVAEQLRVAIRALGTILGIDATEAMLDTLFGRFCIGK